MSKRQEELELLYGKNYKKELSKEQIEFIEQLLDLEEFIPHDGIKRLDPRIVDFEKEHTDQ